MQNKLRYIGIFALITFLGAIFIYTQGLFAPASAKKAIKGVLTTNEEGLNPKIHYDYLTYDNSKDLCAASDVVIKGEVINTKSPDVMILGSKNFGDHTETWKEVFTVSEIRIIESVKGTYGSGDVIQVRQLGGYYKGRDYPTDSQELFAKNMQGIFFLVKRGDYADLISPSQGFVKLVNDKVAHAAPSSKRSKVADDRVFKNGIDQKELIELIKGSI